jgi:hypothetical protein
MRMDRERVNPTAVRDEQYSALEAQFTRQRNILVVLALQCNFELSVAPDRELFCTTDKP